MVESLSELRRRLQEPVRPYNDIAGVLFGDWVSLPITRAFLVLGLSPTVGTVGMLVCGLAGSALVAAGGAATAVGFFLVWLYYVLDCVDGEVARYRGCEKLEWAFLEFFFHLWVKSAFFLALGLYAVEVTGRPWVGVFALTALLSTLYQKFLRDVALCVTSRAALLRTPRERAWAVRQLAPEAGEPPREGPPVAGPVPYPSFGGPLATLRAVLTNFDVSLVFFTVAALADLVVPRFDVLGLRADLVVLLYAYYGVVLPLHFADHLVTYARGERFARDCRALMSAAHHFRIER